MARVALLLFALAVGLMSGALAQSPSAPAPAPAEKRIALVIGNGKYPAVPLPNPENDARLMATTLRKLGFDVVEKLNLTAREFRRALRDFAGRLQQEDAVAVLYYAGHGVQIDGRNYLLPIDLNLQDREEVKDDSVDIEELFLSKLDLARSKARIVILDACRDNPFAKKTRNVRSAGGLAEMSARGTLIAYASAPGAPAEDGPKGGNSVYTKNLAEEMTTRGLEVEQMFKNVRVKVLRDTKERQVPWVNTSLVSNFSFNPGRAAPTNQELAQQAEIRRLEAEIERMRKAQQASVSAVTVPAAASPPVQQVPSPAASAQRVHELQAQLEGVRKTLADTKAQSAAPTPSQPDTLVAKAEPSATAPVTRGGREWLGKTELEQLMVGKTYSFKQPQSGRTVTWNLRSGGAFYSTVVSAGFGNSGSGTWEIKDDGALCMKWNYIQQGDPGCSYFFRDGDKVQRTGARTARAQVSWTLEKAQ